jgi:hypothetical protein
VFEDAFEVGGDGLGVDQHDRAIGVAGVVGECRARTELLPPPWPPMSAWPYLRSAAAIETGPRSSRSSSRACSRAISGGAIARQTVARGSRACVTVARGSCHSVSSSDVESTPARHPGSACSSPTRRVWASSTLVILGEVPEVLELDDLWSDPGRLVAHRQTGQGARNACGSVICERLGARLRRISGAPQVW